MYFGYVTIKIYYFFEYVSMAILALLKSRKKGMRRETFITEIAASTAWGVIRQGIGCTGFAQRTLLKAPYEPTCELC